MDTPETVLARHTPHVCPWWLAWSLANPVRRWLDNPEALLGDFVRPGDRVLEIGPGVGFYTLPMVRHAGATGKVVCVDVQQRMLNGLQRRLAHKGVSERVETFCCATDDRWLEQVRGSMDRAVLIYVLHEVPDPRKTLAEVYEALRPGGMLLLVEPKGHVPAALFAAQGWAARQVGFTDAGRERWDALTGRQAALFRK